MRTRFLFFISFVLAFCSIGYEFAIARTLTEMTGRGSQAQALTVAFYILGLGIGAHFAKTQGEEHAFKRLISFEIALALLGAISVFILQVFHLISYTNFVPDIYFLLAAQIVSLVLGTLSGVELPYLLQLTRSAKGERPTFIVLGLNYMGAMVAAVACTYFFFPALSGNQIVFFFAVLNLLAAMVLLTFFDGVKWKFQIGISLLALTFSIYVRALPLLDLRYLQYYYSMQIQVDFAVNIWERIQKLDDSVAVERVRTPYQVLDFVERKFPDVNDGLLTFRYEEFLYINGQVQIRIGKDNVYHELFAHVPTSLSNTKPKDVLVLGGGDGLLARELLRQDSIESIKLVELDPEVIRIASSNPKLVEANKGVFKNPKVSTVINDAYVFIRKELARYDAIYIDLPFPFDEDLNKLYSYEFYANVLRALKPNGFVAIDFPLNRGQEVSELIFHTLKKAGFNNIIGFGEKTTFVAAAKHIALNNDHAHDLLSEETKKYNIVHTGLFSSTAFDNSNANSALRPLLVGH